MHPNFGSDALRSALFTDLYELTMAQAYDSEGMDKEAVFELFFRKLPKGRNFILAAGLDDVLTYLESFHFAEDDLDYLRDQGQVSNSLLDRLRKTRFTGEVWAVPEGTVVFPNEPLVQVIAPIFEAQLVETFILNQIHFQNVAASKGARVALAAQGRMVIEFGARRALGTDAALKAARSSYLAGATGTSLVLAGKLYGIPIYGTMAHSYVQAHESELASFEAFARIFPETTLLVDTYDTLQGVKQVIELSRQFGEKFQVRAIRLDSGNLGTLAKDSRKLLDDAGLRQVRIFASSSLDEYKIEELLRTGAPIDAFGVGTRLAVAEDAPSLDMAYKLVEYAGKPRMKLSADKVIFPGRKQVFRQIKERRMDHDILACHDEALTGEPLLAPVMQQGKRLPAGQVSLSDARRHAQHELERLPERLRRLAATDSAYDVIASEALNRKRLLLQNTLAAAHGSNRPLADAISSHCE